jgi:hypothetical protein
MRKKYQILSLLLALMLVGSNMAFSSHISSHALTDPGFCSLCIHPGKPDHAIKPELSPVFVVPTTFAVIQVRKAPRYLPAALLGRQSRAPPIVT